MSERFGLVVVAAGNSRRMGQAVRKPYLRIGGKPLLIHTLQAFQGVAGLIRKVLVIHPEEVERTRALLQEYDLEEYAVIVGGEERQKSVAAGLSLLKGGVDYVLIHDGARPFVSKEMITRIMWAVMEKRAVIPAFSIPDTIKRVDPEHKVAETIDRTTVKAAQTPQAFELILLEEAMRRADEAGELYTDEAALLERMGMDVYMVEGEKMNFKITTPEDLLFAEGLIGLWKKREFE